MELTRTDVVFSRIVMVLFSCRNKSSRNDLKNQRRIILEYIINTGRKIHVKGASTCPRGWGRAPYLMGPLTLHRPQPGLHIFTFGEKKTKEKDSTRFTIRSHRQALNSLGRADLVHSGVRRGESVAIVIINLPPSPVS